MIRAPASARRLVAATVWALLAGLVQAQELPDMTPPAEQRPAEQRPAGPPPNATVEQARPFGYFVGDVIVQRILLQLDGRDFQPAPLPRPERAGNWLERRPLRIETGADGSRWLVAEFQVINAPQVPTATSIPAWELRAADGSTPLRIGEWPVRLSPLTRRDDLGPVEVEMLRPDRPAPFVATEPLQRRIAIWSGTCAATLVLWLAWWLWRTWRASATQPFARALREMRRFDDAAPEAWHALHRAFDRTAGRTMQTATLPDLFGRAPHLLPLREGIERFFRQSNQRFFGNGLATDPLSVRGLCAELRRAEKRHER
jgi:mxaA protein